MTSPSQVAVNVHAAVTPVPSPVHSPVATPVVHAALVHAAQVSTWVTSLTSFLTHNELLLVTLGAAVLVYVQTLVNKLPWLQHDVAEVQYLRRQLVSLFLPGLAALGVYAVTKLNTLGLWPSLYALGQLVYALWNRIKVQALNPQPLPPGDTNPAGPVG